MYNAENINDELYRQNMRSDENSVYLKMIYVSETVKKTGKNEWFLLKRQLISVTEPRLTPCMNGRGEKEVHGYKGHMVRGHDVLRSGGKPWLVKITDCEMRSVKK